MLLETKKRFLIIAVTFLFLIVPTAILAISSEQEYNNFDSQRTLMNNVTKRMDDLNYYSDVFLIDSQTGAISQWNSSYDAIYGNLSLISIYSSTEGLLVRQTLNSLIELKQNMTTRGYLVLNSDNQTLINIFWNQISPEIRQIETDSSNLSLMINNESTALLNAFTIYILVLISALAAFVVIVYTQIYGHTMKSITLLQQHRKDLQQVNFELESALKDEAKRLESSERLAALGETAGMIGHDIRNPLQAIINELFIAKELANDALLSNDEKNEAMTMIDTVQKQIDYISKIVSDMQEYSRPLTPEYNEVRLAELIKDILLTIPIPENIELSKSIEENAVFRTDSTFIRRVLTNLINNAVQAMPEGGKLELSCSRIERAIQIFVSDTGKGIPEEIKPHIFKPLKTTKAKGHGFGLAVAKRLVESLNGSITFESEVGKGTKFTILLPISEN